MLKSATGILNKSHRRRSPKDGCPYSSGFTLIELLVVIFIVSIIVTFITLSIDTRDEDLRREARRFSALTELALEEAVLRSREMSVVFRADGYAFFMFSQGAWAAVEGDSRLFGDRVLPDGIRMEVVLEGEAVVFNEASVFDETRENPPRAFLLSSGEFTSFEVLFKDRYGEIGYRVIGDFFNGIRVARLGAEDGGE